MKTENTSNWSLWQFIIREGPFVGTQMLIAIYALVIFGIVLPALNDLWLPRFHGGIDYNVWQRWLAHGVKGAVIIGLGVLSVILGLLKKRWRLSPELLGLWQFAVLSTFAVWCAYRISIGAIPPFPAHD
jgi:hypothetical protein